MSARVNPRVAELERTVSVLLRQRDELRKDPGDIPFTGCGDSGCIVAQPPGMHTNGGCSCTARTLRRALMWRMRRDAFLVETIRGLQSVGARLDRVEAMSDAWGAYDPTTPGGPPAVKFASDVLDAIADILRGPVAERGDS